MQNNLSSRKSESNITPENEITSFEEMKLRMLAVLEAVDRFCADNDITYSLACGTLIGAVRHKGFIPWDDDLDICMPRESYDRFLQTFPTKNNHFILVDPSVTDQYVYNFAKVIDTETILVETDMPRFPLGINIDVFPIDYVTENKVLRKLVFILKEELYHTIINKNISILHTYKFKSIIHRIISKCVPLTTKQLQSIYTKMVYRKRPTSIVCNMSGQGPLTSDGCFSAKCFESTIDIPFEGRTYKAMVGYDEYLTKRYGNYMELPPEDQRIAHHKYKVYHRVHI